MTGQVPQPPPTSPTAATATGAELPPQLVAKLKLEVEGYQLLERLGQGGQATVYRARRTKDGLVVAIKILHSGPHADEQARARLHRETNALRALNHPNIVHAIAAGRTRSGLDCLVMNSIDGRPLDALWDDDAFSAAVAPEPAARLRLFKQICETVQSAHRKGITHRDLIRIPVDPQAWARSLALAALIGTAPVDARGITVTRMSPSNILIDTKGQPHILDFGMASTAFDGVLTPGGRNITVTGQFIGKIRYASPEQARGARDAIDIRSDVYALGVMLYQILTDGAFPYEVVGNVIDVLNNIIHSKPRPLMELVGDRSSTSTARHSGSPVATSPRIRRNPPLVNETIEAVVLKALEKQPEHRYQSAGELAADIDHYLAGRPTSAGAWLQGRAARRSGSAWDHPRRSTLVAASIVTLALLTGALVNARALLTSIGLVSAVVPGGVPADTGTAIAHQAQSQPAQPAGDKRLNKLAEDLAFAEAQLRAVDKRLEKVGVAVPASSSAPQGFDEFCARIGELSNASGRPIRFELIGKEERDRRETAEADSIASETDKDVLLDRRRRLDAQQAALWAQLAWGAVAGREIDITPIYRYQLKSPAIAEAQKTGDRIAFAKGRVLNEGVKSVRTLDAALQAGAVSLKAGNNDAGAVDLAEVLALVGEQTKGSLVALQTTAVDSRNADGLAADDKTSIDGIKAAAQRVMEAMEGATDANASRGKASDEFDRSVSRTRLQRNLLDTFDAAAQLDERLAALSKQWKVEVDSTIKLAPIAPAVAKAKPEVKEPAPQKEPKAAGLAAIFPRGSTWSGRDGWSKLPTRGTITRVDGRVATMRYENDIGTWEITFEIRQGRVWMGTLDGVGRQNDKNVFAQHFNIRVSAPLDGDAAKGDLVLTGTMDGSRPPNKSWIGEKVKFELKRD